MRIHITNINGTADNDPAAARQHSLAEAGRSLGFTEMGIYRYPVNTDTKAELGKRIDGIISSLRPGDFVIVQLPTGNGAVFEGRFYRKLKAYPEVRIVTLFHPPLPPDYGQDEQLQQVMRLSDRIVYAKEHHHIHALQKDLLDAVWPFLERKEEANEPLGEDRAVFMEKCWIPVCFGLHDRDGAYAANVGVTMMSVMRHTREALCFHILHDGTLTEINRQRLRRIAEDGGARILFHRMDIPDPGTRNYTVGSLYRLCIPKVLAANDKAIYLDADLLFCRDIGELWKTDIDGYALGAVRDMGLTICKFTIVAVEDGVPYGDYFNSGLLLMNLKRIREQGDLLDRALAYIISKEQHYLLPDQDALNVLFRGQVRYLDPSWNVFVKYLPDDRFLRDEVYHFVGRSLRLQEPGPADRKMLELLADSPFAADALRKKYKEAMERSMDVVGQLQYLLKRHNGGLKKIYLYVEKASGQEKDALNKLLTPREGDYHIDSALPKEENDGFSGDNAPGLWDGVSVKKAPLRIADDGLPVFPMETVLSEPYGSFVILFLPGDGFEDILAYFKAQGLLVNRDVFNILRLLTTQQGGYC